MAEKKEVKQPKTVMLKPVNITWLKKQAHDQSTAEDRVSDSQILDRLIDEARQKSEAEPSSLPQEKKRTAQGARQIILAA